MQAACKARGLLFYRGVHRSGAAYEHGDEVTFGGQLWVAK
jgi:hypothetical protein